MPTGLNGRADAAIQYHLLPGADVKLLGGIEGLTGYPNIPLAGHHQMIILPDLNLALTMGDAQLIGLELMPRGAGDDDAAFVINLNPLIM